MEQNVQLFAWNDCTVHGQLSSSGIRETQGCESSHSPRGHEGLLYAGLGDGTWTTYLERTCSQQVADCLTKMTTPLGTHRKALGL